MIAPPADETGIAPTDFTGTFDGGGHTIRNLALGNDRGMLGGLVGQSCGGYIAESYAVGHISAGKNSQNLGGLIGSNLLVGANSLLGATGEIHDSYFLIGTGGGPDNGFGLPLTNGQMKQQASFGNWDFTNTWTICEGQDYPRLRWEKVCDK